MKVNGTYREKFPERFTPHEYIPPYTPRTWVCEFWLRGQKMEFADGCRFLDNECQNLHSMTDNRGKPTSVYPGKPQWGALADFIDKEGRASPAITEITGRSMERSMRAPSRTKKAKKNYTCSHWSIKKCTLSAETCEFSHQHMPDGLYTRLWTCSFWAGKGCTKGAKSCFYSHCIMPAGIAKPPEPKRGEYSRRYVAAPSSEIQWGKAAKEDGSSWGSKSDAMYAADLQRKTLQQQVGW